MPPVFDCHDESQLLAGMRQARQALGRGRLIVLPTDTVYGVAADAFQPDAVRRLIEAKGRDRTQPPPVLVANRDAMTALVEEVPEPVARLVERFWPGALTVVLPAQPSLTWDLGETRGTVAVRMPDLPLALELLEETGPLAVSSANLTGRPAAINVDMAVDMLQDTVEVYLDAGHSRTGVASTIVDATSLVGDHDEPRVRVLRDGAISRDELREVLGELLELPLDEDGIAPALDAEDAAVEDGIAPEDAPAPEDAAAPEDATPAPAADAAPARPGEEPA